jgi:uncharacterized protein YbjT (DUF2867 family)
MCASKLSRSGVSGGEILVTAPTGNVGRPTAEQLLEAGARVRIAARDPEAAAAALPNGVRAVRFDFTDPSTFAAAAEGVTALFLLRPPAIARVRGTLNRFVDAAAAAGVRHCVFVSVEGAERNRMLPHRKVEDHLRASALTWTFLRPGFYAQNLLDAYRGDISRGRLVLPAGDGRVAFVDTRDVGEVAAKALLAPGEHAGQAYHLTGVERETFAGVAEILTEVLGRPVEYEPVSALAYAKHLRRQEHASPVRILVLSLLHANVRRGKAAEVDATLERLLGRAPRTVRDVVVDYRDALA